MLKNSRFARFPMSFTLFMLFYDLACTMYTSSDLAAHSAARMTHAYMTADLVVTTGLQAALESEGLDFQTTCEVAEAVATTEGYHAAVRRLLVYLQTRKV